MKENVQIVTLEDGRRIVKIDDIIFKGKRGIDWNEVEKYLKKFVGEFHQITETSEIVYIGSDFPDEYVHSNYTKRIRGTAEKAKANASQGIAEMIEIAHNKVYSENHKEKHSRDAGKGWYRYTSRFALPVFGMNNEIERYNVFQVTMLMRHSKKGKIYLYDVIDIKKETGALFGFENPTQ
jgi:hypothetical protein